MKKSKLADKVYAHQMVAENYQKFVEAEMTTWWEFTHRLEYAQAWKEHTQFTPQEAKIWAREFEGNPHYAAEYRQVVDDPIEAGKWWRLGYSVEFCIERKKMGRKPRRVTQPRPQQLR